MVTVTIDPILFSFGHFMLRWYGLIVAAAIGVGLWIATSEAKRKGLGKTAHECGHLCVALASAQTKSAGRCAFLDLFAALQQWAFPDHFLEFLSQRRIWIEPVTDHQSCGGGHWTAAAALRTSATAREPRVELNT
ncbi:MAG TPA: prolipoprotein diacylglyceryl transferase [Chloroflexi bacterium]|nr:prolipoprotein diacylglyceryl transferase [Chloroflexota bacterium]